MSLRTSRRVVLRTTVAATALASAVLAPTAVAFADTTPSPSKTPSTCVAVKEASIGAGTTAVMTIAPSGPSVTFKDAGSGEVLPERLDRTHPNLPTDRFLAEILEPNGPAPKLRTNMEGGGHKASVKDFPKLPQGCSFTYATGSGGQTTVVPKGSVAAGAEYGRGGSDTALIAVGGAAGLGLLVLLRRRRAAAAGR
ncbi:hypothetical protein J7F03_28995 [Streptomyces sp. ISL-43]|uniref:hypothetical protein n=1 Tax=Streptomyces sp. ISL-43 TaxID=2819183 RepID=UPI001BE5BC1C|nr:hypothetical protein [Streptomyces sp. ISL-43]MBT2451042.1 hypothetical protein [Streptomyces sp. ISL-43]